MTRDRIGKHSKTVNTPKKKGLVSSNLRKNRPMTSGDISIKSKPTRLTINENGRILKHTRMNAFDSCRAVARALIGGGGVVYIHIFRLCPTSFF